MAMIQNDDKRPGGVLCQPGSQDHFVQFYGDNRVLVENVAQYLKEGSTRGDWMIVIATGLHGEMIVRRLKDAAVAVDDLVRAGRLQILDAGAMLARFMVDGRPVWEKFDATVGQLVRDMQARSSSRAVRAYGEMVNLLWTSGQLNAATQLEEFWNRLIVKNRFSLFCSYAVDILSRDVDSAELQEILRTHSHLLPVRHNGELDHAVDRALRDVLGEQSSAALKPLIRFTHGTQAALPPAEATILWLRNHLPPYADEVLARARMHYEAECLGKSGTGGN